MLKVLKEDTSISLEEKLKKIDKEYKIESVSFSMVSHGYSIVYGAVVIYNEKE